MYQLTVEHSFDAAHFLAGYQGKCRNIHGHRFRALLFVESETLREDTQERGMCMDFSIVKQAWKEMLEEYDHNFLIETGSLQTDTMKALRAEGFSIMELPFRPTAENLAKHFYEKMEQMGFPVSQVQVYETPNNCATYMTGMRKF